MSVLVSDFLVLFPVGTGVMLDIDITGRPKSITVWYQVLFPVDTGVLFKILGTGK